MMTSDERVAKGSIIQYAGTAESIGPDFKEGDFLYVLADREDGELSCIRISADGGFVGKSDLVFANEARLVLRDASPLVRERHP
jgi:hypothetical protein